ncbi:tRNA pseudouridine synthase A [Fulvivirga imtechensis AK7]|uniref:tRNA pseudouridine synthase A n=1 Tax=Fulvivirga imtechensis AK7 TaxID=1237149 RepID=L8JPE4_9BACT|nr:tRNA pseudouridine(38-40) synthase TruA [Fulvivirga imtechensis]ELR70710.1 tRNA pseudouridine synthase A [Fulvivirga imtechensis AK7]
MRYFFEISYDGSHYHGWQRQKNAISVQEVVEDALSMILRKPIAITGSGRTDTGVHCEQQYFHADIDNPVKPEQLRRRLNSYLPADIAIPSVKWVSEDAHARFSAVSRSYEYRITTEKNPFLENFSYFYPKSLDIQTMNEVATLLLGVHDFEAFSKVRTDVNNFVCEITAAQWVKEKDLYIFKITANRFLRGMVRAVVGTLLNVGKGKMPPGQFKEIIASKDRREAGSAAPACGLFLTEVRYPAEIFLD